DAVNIPIGIVRPHDADNHYTMYQTVINLTTRTLYIKYYGSNELVALKLTDDLINRKDMTIFKPEKHITIRKLNDNQ
ncbi:MAG: linear amide C-N hydrolase, partial [Staphylococcus aureus]|nr:linear amide C-N hydrolase [Staphylococcus aureus]